VLSNAGCVITDPGHVTARRLNRAEYESTVRDLLSVDIPDLASDFPSDDVGYGFDNIGDVLSTSPLHIEKYLRAARKAVRAAIVAPEDEDEFHRGVTVPGRLLQGDGLPDDRGGRAFGTNGGAGFMYDFRVGGAYWAHIVGWEQHAESEYAKVAVHVSRKEAAVVDVTSPDKDHPSTSEAEIYASAGKQWVDVAFINDFYNAAKREDRNVWVESVQLQPAGDTLLGQAPTPFEYRYLQSLPPFGASTAVQDAAMRRFLAAFLLHAYRRPATPTEVTRLVQLAADIRADGGSYKRGVQAAVEAALVSPRFLFRIERDPAPTDTHPVRYLDDYELATRLSYFLSGSMPDDHLLELARKGTLHRPEVLVQETRRLLRDPHTAQSLADNFAAQWLTLRRLDRVTPDTGRFPLWNADLRDAMRTETLLYFSNVVAQDRSVLDFLDSNYTFLNEPLARLYGNTEVKGPDFRLVRLQSGRRGGVLTQASVLTVTSNPTRTSPVKRGKWVLENLLGEAVPMPPPGVPQLPDDAQHTAPLTGTLRQRLEEHRRNPACAQCHQRMDPIGFGLENYNAIGMWRTHEDDGGSLIDASGVLPDGRRFRGPVELRAVLKGMAPQFVRNLSDKLLTFAIGRGTESYDRCAVDAIAAHAAASGYRFSALVEAIVASEPFRCRRGDTGPAAPAAVAQTGAAAHGAL
jgi:hypothetical protein